MTAQPPPKPSAGFLGRFGQTRMVWSACILLTVVTLIVYWPVKDHAFINFDDDLYVTANPHVQKGMTIENLKWAFTTGAAFNWHPLTWLSHLVDVQFLGLEAGRHHLVNVFFHILNALLLFLLLHSMTKAPVPSAFVATLFALHPLHVESVAWVAERKDVLSTFFWMLSLGAYVSYVRRADYRWYLLGLLFFVFGLMSKPMLVTMPFLLLMLDYWPLARFRTVRGDVGSPRKRDPADHPARKIRKKAGTRTEGAWKQEGGDAGPSRWSIWRPLLWEKAPFLAFSLISSIITLYVQQETVRSLQRYPLDARLANAIVSTVKYLGMMLWPRDLAVFYPHPGMQPIGSVLGAVFCLAAITLLVVWKRKRFPYLGVGWLWYVATLIPVIGLIQVGSQAMADRYTYVPLIGPFIMIAWGVPDLIPEGMHRRPVLGLLAGGATLACIILTVAQLRFWQNSETLFRHALSVTTDNYLAHTNLGFSLSGRGQIDEAITHFRNALRIKPNTAEALSGLGNAYGESGRIAEAIEAFEQAIRIKPGYAESLNNLGVAYGEAGHFAQAVRPFRQSLDIKPGQADVWNNLGVALGKVGRTTEAIEAFQEALRIKPDYAKAWVGLGLAYSDSGQEEQAREAFTRLKAIDPALAGAFSGKK